MITDFVTIKIPKNRARRQLLLSQIHDEAYGRGFQDGKKSKQAELQAIALEKENLEKRMRNNSVQALSNVGEALSVVARALADVVEPRRV